LTVARAIAKMGIVMIYDTDSGFTNCYI